MSAAANRALIERLRAWRTALRQVDDFLSQERAG
jgi:hypothetical protein